MKKLLVCCGLLTISASYWFFTQSISKTNSMKIFSSAFNKGEWIPKKYSGEGLDINPPLHWENVPKNAKSLVLIMDDPDAPDTKPDSWIHWIVFNIAPTMQGLPEKASIVAMNARQGLTNSGKSEYHGPYPDPGVGTHHYYFTLYALDKMLDLPEGASKNTLNAVMKDHIIETAQLMGLYERK